MTHAETLQTALAIAFFLTIAFAGLLYARERARRHKALQRWASSCGYRIVHARQALLSEASPFPISSSKAQQIFRITVQDEQGTVRLGWLILGSAWRGLNSPKATLKWDEPE